MSIKLFKTSSVFSQPTKEAKTSINHSENVERPTLSELGLFLDGIIKVRKNFKWRFEKLTTNALNFINKKHPNWEDPKPILKRLSSLSAESANFYGVSDLWIEFYCNGQVEDWYSTQNFQPWSLARLASHHYDVFGWIDKGFAIDLDTLDTNPYSPFVKL